VGDVPSSWTDLSDGEAARIFEAIVAEVDARQAAVARGKERCERLATGDPLRPIHPPQKRVTGEFSARNSKVMARNSKVMTSKIIITALAF
jgi:hypothetical protein